MKDLSFRRISPLQNLSPAYQNRYVCLVVTQEIYEEYSILDFGLGSCLFESISGEIFPAVEGDLPKRDAPDLYVCYSISNYSKGYQ